MVRPTREHVDGLVGHVRRLEPRFVCISHARVRDALEKHPSLSGPLSYGVCGPLIRDSDAILVLNYFPNGNAIPDETKLRIFRDLRDLLRPSP